LYRDEASECSMMEPPESPILIHIDTNQK
jgi:hypothetical protein